MLEESFARFAALLADVPDDALLTERVEQFVKRAWEHFSSPHYRSTFEILIHASAAFSRDAVWREQMQRAWGAVWSEVFSNEKLPRRRAVALQQFTVASLAGLASPFMLKGKDTQARAGDLELLWAVGTSNVIRTRRRGR